MQRNGRDISLWGLCNQLTAALAFLLAFTPILQALILNTPQPPEGFDAILPDGPANVSWTLESGDPSEFTLEIQNNVTLDSYEFARAIQASSLFLVQNMSGVAGSPHYFMQAVTVGNILDVLSNSPEFVVAGAVASTTNLLSSSLITGSASRTSSASTGFSSNTSLSAGVITASSSQTSTSSSGQVHSGTPVRTIVGGVVGGVAGFCLVAIHLYILFRRRRRRHSREKVHFEIDADDTTIANRSLDSNPNLITPMLQTEPSREALMSSKAALSRDLNQLRDQKARVVDMRQQLADSRTAMTGDQSVSVRGTDPETQYQLEAMSRRIVELEEREQSLLREVADLAPPDYESAAGEELHIPHA